LQEFKKSKNDKALKHIFKIRRTEYSKDAKEFENNALKEEIGRMVEIKK